MSDLPNDDDQKKPTLVVPGIGKEREGKQEITPMTEFTRNVDLEPEVESWLEKLEKEDKQLQQPVVNQTTGQVVLDDSAQQPTGFKVVLPLTKGEGSVALQQKVINSVRWLAEWCLRMVKMFGNKVTYRRK